MSLIDFDPDWYSDSYPDVPLSGLDPAEHYQQFGKAWGRSGRPGQSEQPPPSISSTTTDSFLVPLNQLYRICDGYWLSTDTDPHFLHSGNFKEQGWFIFELKASIEQSSGTAKFYLDFGEGFSESSMVSLPYVSGAPIARVAHLATRPRQIRFDPSETPGTLALADVKVRHISVAEALSSMKDRLRQFCPDRLDLIEAEHAPIGLEKSEVFETYNRTFSAKSPLAAYKEWISKVEIPGRPTRKEISSFVVDTKNLPTISIILPTYNSPQRHLEECLESVLSQSYPKWELCIADDASTLQHVRETLRSYEKRDKRIKVVFREKNGHISRCSNSALEIATGDFVALLDHDDALAADALYYVARIIVQNPQARLIYSDEDKIDEFGDRYDPHFKGGWNRDLLLSQNYISHLSVLHTQTLRESGGFRTGVEGSQDHDLLLRYTLRIKPDQIIHIPRVLYHWRSIAGSTAATADGKGYTSQSGMDALRHYFDERGSPKVDVVAGRYPNTYRLVYPVPSPEPKVSLLIPTRDKRSVTEVAVRSILEKTKYSNFEVIIINNGSTQDETVEFFREIQSETDKVRVIDYNRPFNYSSINNFGVRQTHGDIVGLINNDVEVIDGGWLREMVSHSIRPEIGCVGAKLYYSNDTIQHAGVIVGIGGVAGHSHKYFPRSHPGYFTRLHLLQNVSAVTAACLLVRREIYEQVGGLDEKNLQVAFNDVDFCLKVKAAGYLNLWTPYAELYHHESISRGHEDTPEKVARFNSEVQYMQNKWGKTLERDDYYSPNLSYDREDFSIAL